MRAKLKNGGVGARGGRRPGAGRKPDWLKVECQKIIEREKLIQFLGDVAAGRVMDNKVNNGVVIKVPASLADRRACAVELLDRGFGKAIQTVAGDSESPPALLVFPNPTNADQWVQKYGPK
jgi:hypothetical protein